MYKLLVTKDTSKRESLLYALKVLPFILIMCAALYVRLPYFFDFGKDVYAYQRAIEDFFRGINPYEYTISTFNNPDDMWNHGYSYLPGFLYLFGFIYSISLYFNFSDFQFLWKIPVIFSDVFVGYLLFRYLLKKDYLFALISTFIWFFNPYNMFRTGYSYVDPVPVLFLLIALLYLEKDEVMSGAFYGLSIIFKTFPIILFPIFLLLSKDKLKMILACLIIGIFLSLPFITSKQDFMNYLNGTILVHGERQIQGRPFLFYISYYFDVEFFQIIPIKVYSYMSAFVPWITTIFLYFVFKVKNKHILSLFSLLSFFILTPVLNRTYVLWLIPFLLLGLFYLFKNRKYLYYIFTIIFHVFYSWYLIQWKDGFHIWRP